MAQSVAKYLGWKISNCSMHPCEHCAKAKAKQKNVMKVSKAEKAKQPGKQVYLDLSKVTVSKLDGTEFEINQKHWKIIIDECTGKKWSDFMDLKIGMVEQTCKFLNLMKSRNVPIKCIRLDPADENSALKS